MTQKVLWPLIAFMSRISADEKEWYFIFPTAIDESNFDKTSKNTFHFEDNSWFYDINYLLIALLDVGYMKTVQ